MGLQAIKMEMEGSSFKFEPRFYLGPTPSRPHSSLCDINSHTESCQRGSYRLFCLAFVCINTQLFGTLTALCKDESRESRRDWWALWVDRAPLSSPHPSFRQGFLITVQPPETKAAMFVQMDWVGLIFLTSLLLQQWPTLAGCIHCWSDTCIR